MDFKNETRMLRRVDAKEQICTKSMEIVIFSTDFYLGSPRTR